MIIDFRYHIASLVAVFLALFLGILIGGVVIGNPALEKELRQIQEDLSKLRSDQKTLNTEIAKRDEELKIYNQFGAAVVPSMVRGKLLGKRVALVRTNPNVPAGLVKDLSRLFATAGAKVNSTTTFLCDPADLDPDRLAELGERLGLAAAPADLPPAVLRLAIDRIVNGPMFEEQSSRTVLTNLASAKLLEIGGSYDGMVDILVLIGGNMDPNLDSSRQIDRVLIETATQSKGLMVAAVEPANAAKSYLPEYLKHGIIVVDNVETAPGQTALILALVRGRKGHYGIKGANQLLPEAF